ncbi:MAG: hypothetical protein FJ028_10685 [Chloroflexi bacterium]|nr:hypothetical protein [Chloroflexota bacterium]
MNGLGWLDVIFGSVRCANCGAAYDRTAVNVVGNRDEYWSLPCVCHTCGTQGVGVVIVREVEVPAGEVAPTGEGRVGVDDVLSAHELLRDYAGDVHGLFAGGHRAGR